MCFVVRFASAARRFYCNHSIFALFGFCFVSFLVLLPPAAPPSSYANLPQATIKNCWIHTKSDWIKVENKINVTFFSIRTRDKFTNLIFLYLRCFDFNSLVAHTSQTMPILPHTINFMWKWYDYSNDSLPNLQLLDDLID